MYLYSSMHGSPTVTMLNRLSAQLISTSQSTAKTLLLIDNLTDKHLKNIVVDSMMILVVGTEGQF